MSSEAKHVLDNNASQNSRDKGNHGGKKTGEGGIDLGNE